MKNSVQEMPAFKRHNLSKETQPLLCRTNLIRKARSESNTEGTEKKENQIYHEKLQITSRKDFRRKKPNMNSSMKIEEKNNTKVKMQEIKNQVIMTLIEMTYHEKIQHLESLLKEAKRLAAVYGYFYTTSAMIIFTPQSQLKFTIWIHPDFNHQQPLHPISKSSSIEAEKEFYTSLKRVFAQLFPSISLGPGWNYAALMSHIDSLKKAANNRQFSQRSTFSKVDLSSKQKHQEKTEMIENAIIPQEEKLDSPNTTIESVQLGSLEKEMDFLFQDQQSDQQNGINWYNEESFLTGQQKQMLKTVTEEFDKILS